MPTFGWKYVLTSPEKTFHDIDNVIKLLDKKNFDSYYIVKEYGENSDNPHLNVAIQVGGHQSLKNMARDLKKAYYGKKLEEYNKMPGFIKHGVKCGGIPHLLGFKLFANYLKKEANSEVVKEHNCSLEELTEGLDEYQPKPKRVKKVDSDELVEELIKIHKEQGLGKASTLTYRQCVCKLSQLKPDINLRSILNRPAIYYCDYANKLGNISPMYHYLSKALEDFIKYEPITQD